MSSVKGKGWSVAKLGVLLSKKRYQQISSKDNQWVKEYHQLVSLKKYRDQTGLFAIESVKLVVDAATAGVEVKKVFVTKHCLEMCGATLQKLFECLDERNVLIISAVLAKTMTLTKNDGGIFAICKKLDKKQLSDRIVSVGQYLYLCHLQDTGNVGTIIRTAHALGFSGVILSSGTVDIYNLKVLRASMSSVFHLPLIFGGEAYEDLKIIGKTIQTYASVTDPKALNVRTLAFSTHGVLVLGNEGNGLPGDVVSCCSYSVTIPMVSQIDSLNVSMAAGILMWEMVHAQSG